VYLQAWSCQVSLDPPALPMTALIPPDEIKQTLPQFLQEEHDKAPV